MDYVNYLELFLYDIKEAIRKKFRIIYKIIGKSWIGFVGCG